MFSFGSAATVSVQSVFGAAVIDAPRDPFAEYDHEIADALAERG